MKDPNDTRDIGPRVGSPLWIHLVTVTAAGAVALALALLGLHGLAGHSAPGHPGPLIARPMFWLLVTLILVGEIWPIITPGRSGQESPIASVTFSFAALLFWGLPIAVLLRATSTLAVGLARAQGVQALGLQLGPGHAQPGGRVAGDAGLRAAPHAGQPLGSQRP